MRASAILKGISGSDDGSQLAGVICGHLREVGKYFGGHLRNSDIEAVIKSIPFSQSIFGGTCSSNYSNLHHNYNQLGIINEARKSR